VALFVVYALGWLPPGEIMRKDIVPLLAIGLLAASVAHAQSGGHGRRGQGGPSPSAPAPASPNTAAPAPRSIPTNQIEIVGVVKAIAPDDGRVTIAYEPVEALNWPSGSMPFVVSKSALLKDITVGEKVRFRLESEQIADLRPF
jgi:Cu/Ag efflux protein CusF